MRRVTLPLAAPGIAVAAEFVLLAASARGIAYRLRVRLLAIALLAAVASGCWVVQTVDYTAKAIEKGSSKPAPPPPQATAEEPRAPGLPPPRQ